MLYVIFPPSRMSDFVAFLAIFFLLVGSLALCSEELLVPPSWLVTTTWICLSDVLHVRLPSNRASFLISSVLVFPAAFPTHIICVVFNICWALCWWQSNCHSGDSPIVTLVLFIQCVIIYYGFLYIMLFEHYFCFFLSSSHVPEQGMRVATRFFSPCVRYSSPVLYLRLPSPSPHLPPLPYGYLPRCNHTTSSSAFLI